MDLQSKSMDWFLYDNDLRHERVNTKSKFDDNLLFKSSKLINFIKSGLLSCYINTSYFSFND